MLDPRAQTLLKTLIERYIAEGQPVGSRTLSRYSGLELSPATIRNVMSDLEELGLVASPHTSAGRVPTPRGYRVFVDTMLTVEAPEDEAMTTVVKTRLQGEEPQKIVAAAASVLSNLSSFAGVVLTPRRSHMFKQIETDGVAVFRAQPGFIRYRLMRMDSSTTIAVAEWESERLGKVGAEQYRAWMRKAGIMAHLTLETRAGEIVAKS